MRSEYAPAREVALPRGLAVANSNTLNCSGHALCFLCMCRCDVPGTSWARWAGVAVICMCHALLLFCMCRCTMSCDVPYSRWRMPHRLATPARRHVRSCFRSAAAGGCGAVPLRSSGAGVVVLRMRGTCSAMVHRQTSELPQALNFFHPALS